METDVELNQVFSVAPIELYSLLDLPRPQAARARSVSFKELETTTDIVVEPLPLTDSDPAMIVEFQGYRDKKFIPKLMVRCGLFRTMYPHQTVRCHAIYLDRSFEAANVDDGGLFQPQVHYLPDLLVRLQTTHPNSPILSVLHPIVAESEAELTATAGTDYDNIRTSDELSSEQRDTWLNVFHSWMMKRLKLSIEEIQEMIVTKLPDVEDLPWGQQLKERWTTQGVSQGLSQGRIEGQLSLLRRQSAEFAAMHADGDLSDAVYARKQSAIAQEIERLEAELRLLNERN